MQAFVYVPQTIGQIYEMTGSMMLSAPKFVDKTGYNPDRNIETEFSGLKQGLALVRKQLGEERYTKLVDMVDRMRAHFEADPDDTNGECTLGRNLIIAMNDILKPARGRRPKVDVADHAP